MTSLSEQQMTLIQGIDDVKVMWDTLKGIHYTTDMKRVQAALKEIGNLKTIAGKTIDERVAILTMLNDEITRGDPTLKVLEKMIIVYLIASLPPEYKNIVEIIENSDTPRTLTNVIQTLKLKESDLKSSTDDKLLNVRNGNTASSSRGGRGGRSGRGGQGGRGGQN